jgi:hypothetical protein
MGRRVVALSVLVVARAAHVLEFGLGSLVAGAVGVVAAVVGLARGTIQRGVVPRADPGAARRCSDPDRLLRLLGGSVMLVDAPDLRHRLEGGTS